jgi:hypothetical protein
MLLQPLIEILDKAWSCQKEKTAIRFQPSSTRIRRRTLRRQDRVEGERRDKTINDLPQAASVGQVLKDLNFPADRSAVIKFVEQSNKPERNEVLSVIQRLEDRQYRNVSEVAEAARLVQG